MQQSHELADVSPALELRPVPWGGLVARLRASEALRRCVPLPVALAAIGLAQRISLARNAEKHAFARATAEAVVGATGFDGDLDEIATRHIVARAHAWEYAWRPWLLDRIPVEGLEKLQRVEPGRGVIFSKLHAGPPGGISALSRRVGPILEAVGSYLFAEVPPAGYNGYQNEQIRKLVTRAGFRMIEAQGSAPAFAAELARGGRVFLNFDVPGSTPVRFLGKTVEVKSGTARLAFDTDAVVVPFGTLPRGRGWYLSIEDPLDPRDFSDWQSLLQAVATVQERLALQAPELLESPLRDGGWAEATAAGWRHRSSAEALR